VVIIIYVCYYCIQPNKQYAILSTHSYFGIKKLVSGETSYFESRTSNCEDLVKHIVEKYFRVNFYNSKYIWCFWTNFQNFMFDRKTWKVCIK